MPNDRQPTLSALVRRGIFDENTIFRMAISMCPAIAVTGMVKNALLMGCAVLAVQVVANVTISLIRRHIHPRIRLPIFMVIVAGCVTAVDMLLKAFAPAIYKQIGLYIQLIVAFASILAGLETFASRNGLLRAAFDGVGRGLGFLLALTLIGAVREFLGKGSFYGMHLIPPALPIAQLPAGGFLTVGLLMGLFFWLGTQRRKRSPDRVAPAGGPLR
jgi:Na+-translocating ferredoxin:NAD+ oxidoreductase subunit E